MSLFRLACLAYIENVKEYFDFDIFHIYCPFIVMFVSVVFFDFIKNIKIYRILISYFVVVVSRCTKLSLCVRRKKSS